MKTSKTFKIKFISTFVKFAMKSFFPCRKLWKLDDLYSLAKIAANRFESLLCVWIEHKVAATLSLEQHQVHPPALNYLENFLM